MKRTQRGHAQFGPPEPTFRKLGMVICACNLKVCEIRDRRITELVNPKS